MASKKPKVVDPDKEFLKQARMYLGSLTGRIAIHAYFGVAPRSVVISNTTSDRVHGDRLTDFAVGELGLHVVNFLTSSFYDTLATLLKVQQGTILHVHLGNFLKVLGKYKLSALETFTTERNELVMVSKGSTAFSDENIIGDVVKDFHIAREIVNWHRDITLVGNEEHQKRFPHVILDMPTEVLMTGRVYFLNVDFSLFKNPDGTPLFSKVISKMKMMGVDGLTSVSLTSFVKKLSTPFTFKQYWWAMGNDYVTLLVEFQDENIRVRSFRPYVIALPLNDTIKIDSTTSISEANPEAEETDE